MNEIRDRLSALLMDTSEENHLKVNIILEVPESMGLSTLEMPCVKEIWQSPTEGIINILLYGADEPNELEDYDDCIAQIHQGVLDALDMRSFTQLI